LLIAGGWQYWQNYRNKTLTRASILYDEMLTFRAQNNTQGAIVHAKKLLHRYSSTPYAQMAAFMLAREAVLKKNYSEAEKKLRWVMEHSKEASMKEIARIRLARIYYTKKTGCCFRIIGKNQR
jgi:predicted negative regulator of RcsB-dependent stress response